MIDEHDPNFLPRAERRPMIMYSEHVRREDPVISTLVCIIFLVFGGTMGFLLAVLYFA